MSALRARMFLRCLFLQSGFADESRQALGFAWAMDPALRVAPLAELFLYLSLKIFKNLDTRLF